MRKVNIIQIGFVSIMKTECDCCHSDDLESYDYVNKYVDEYIIQLVYRSCRYCGHIWKENNDNLDILDWKDTEHELI